MKRRKTFKAFVISGKTISLFGTFFIFGIMIGILVFCLKPVSIATSTLVNSEQIYKSALESELPMPQKESGIKQIFDIVLGFDIKNPASIFGANSIFAAAEKGSPEHNILPTPENYIQTPVPTKETEEHNIEEIKISKGMAISNATKFEVNAEELASQPLEFKIDNNGAQVLIVHTHTTESYTDADKKSYTASDSDRSTDTSKNIVQVGNHICDVLNNEGIKTIHDTTVHDYPSFNGAYGRSMTTIQKNLKENPSIKVVLDIHRDGLIREDGTKLKVTTQINGEKTAQVMFVVGTNGSGLAHNNWHENLKLAAKLQKKANDMYPSLMRPINLREERFNQHLTLGSLIIEVGSNGNTLDEAVLGGEYIAKVIAAVLKS
ncbi:MAG: stage II sporulation protein P [Clostridia bacterium]|nr:stage II sporulation protein P [Clostridia bacterium]